MQKSWERIFSGQKKNTIYSKLFPLCENWKVAANYILWNKIRISSLAEREREREKGAWKLMVHCSMFRSFSSKSYHKHSMLGKPLNSHLSRLTFSILQWCVEVFDICWKGRARKSFLLMVYIPSSFLPAPKTMTNWNSDLFFMYKSNKSPVYLLLVM